MIAARRLAWIGVAAVLALPVERAPAWLQVLVLMALVAATWRIGQTLAERLLPGLPAADRALASAVLGIAAWLFVALALGHGGWLTGEAFRAVMAALALAAVFLVPSRRASGQRAPSRAAPMLRVGFAKPDLRGIERAALALACLVAALALAAAIHRERYAPPGRFAFDDTSYHLTTVASWTAHCDLSMPRFTFGDRRTAFYPFAGELVGWGLTTPFGGGDFAARWTGLPFALLTLLALERVARRLGAGRIALLAPLLYGTIRSAFPGGALVAGNDHALAFAALAVVHAALVLRALPTPGVAAYAGAALGLVAGFKYLGLFFVPLLFTLVVVALATSRRGASGARVVALLTACGAALLVGGYAYLRNAVTTGNPIFPVAATLGPWRLPGWPDVTPWQAALDPENAVHPWRFVWNRTDLWGPLFRLSMLPAAALAPIVAMARARRRRTLVVGLLLLPVLFYAEFLWLVADHREVRYLLAAIALAAVAAAWLASRLGAPWRTAAVVLLAAATALRWAIPHPEVAVVAAVLAAAVVVVVRSGRLRWSRRAAALGALGAVVVLVAAAGPVVRRYEEGRLRAFPAARAFAELTGRRPVRVAYLGWNQPYLFCGARQRNVLLTPPLLEIDDAFAPMLYRWREPVASWVPMDPRRAWLRLLAREGVEWVVLVTRAGSVGVERGWIAGAPDRFVLAYADATTEIWRVRR